MAGGRARPRPTRDHNLLWTKRVLFLGTPPSARACALCSARRRTCCPAARPCCTSRARASRATRRLASRLRSMRRSGPTWWSRWWATRAGWAGRSRRAARTTIGRCSTCPACSPSCWRRSPRRGRRSWRCLCTAAPSPSAASSSCPSSTRCRHHPSLHDPRECARVASGAPGDPALGAQVLAAWRPGEEGGPAIWELLLGDHSPSGRLAQAWPRSAGYVHSQAARPLFAPRQPSLDALSSRRARGSTRGRATSTRSHIAAARRSRLVASRATLGGLNSHSGAATHASLLGRAPDARNGRAGGV